MERKSKLAIKHYYGKELEKIGKSPTGFPLYVMVRYKNVKTKEEWLTLQQFKEATGVKSHYSISKMESISEEKGRKFRSKFLGKRRYIHRSEVEKYFSGEFEN